MPDNSITSSLHEAMQKAEDDFRVLNTSYRDIASQPSDTAYWVVQENTLREALTTAAQNLLETRAAVQATNDDAQTERRVEAAAAMAEAEHDLVILVAKADEQMASLVETLARIIDTSKARYAAHHVLHGRSSRRLLAREALNGWLRWRFTALDIPDLRPSAHERHISLAERLGVANRPSTDPANQDSPHDPKEPT